MQLTGVLDNQIHSIFMCIRVSCKNEEDPFKNEGPRVVTKDLPCKSRQIFLTQKCN